MSSGVGSLRGFSLLELLLVLVIVTILISLTLPSLGRVGNEGRTAKSLANVRSHAQILTAYTQDYQETWPFFMRLDVEFTVVRSLEGDDSETGRFFDSQGLWRVALADGYYAGRPADPSFVDPRTASSGAYNLYLYSANFVAHPEWWNLSTRRVAPIQFQSTRMGDVLWPASKVLITSSSLPATGRVDSTSDLSNPNAVAVIAAADGHGARLTWRDAGPQFPSDGAPFRYASYYWPFIGTYTCDGVRGRDLP